MIELIQFPWSPFCLVQRRILEYARAKFKIHNIPSSDRSLVWRVTRQRYYQVPVLKDGRIVIFETDENSQVIAKYLNERFNLDLFPSRWRGVQTIIWRYIENDIEGLTFKLNDIYWEEQTPPSGRLGVLRHKERKFGRGCFDRWREQQAPFLTQLSVALVPFEQMLLARAFLLEDQPVFIDFDLYGMMANFLYSGHYQMPPDCPKLSEWYQRISKAHTSEKLRSRH